MLTADITLHCISYINTYNVYNLNQSLKKKSHLFIIIILSLFIYNKLIG